MRYSYLRPAICNPNKPAVGSGFCQQCHVKDLLRKQRKQKKR